MGSYPSSARVRTAVPARAWGLLRARGRACGRSSARGGCSNCQTSANPCSRVEGLAGPRGVLLRALGEGRPTGGWGSTQATCRHAQTCPKSQGAIISWGRGSPYLRRLRRLRGADYHPQPGEASCHLGWGTAYPARWEGAGGPPNPDLSSTEVVAPSLQQLRAETQAASTTRGTPTPPSTPKWLQFETHQRGPCPTQTPHCPPPPQQVTVCHLGDAIPTPSGLDSTAAISATSFCCRCVKNILPQGLCT